MPCPWYKDGVCTSPLLESPSPDPVVPHICLSDDLFTSCRYYKESEGKSTKIAGIGKPLLLIHSLNHKPKSGCEFFVLDEHESGALLAICTVLRRYLTRYEVKLCESKWRECPFRKIGAKLSRQLATSP